LKLIKYKYEINILTTRDMIR